MTAPPHPSPAPDGKPRCAWVNLRNPDYILYHDHEWGVPLHNDQQLFELLVLETFQAGLSWECVLNKRQAFRKAFHGFSPQRVAAMTAEDIEQMLLNPFLIRHRRKLQAAIANARVFLQVQQELGSFDGYLWGWTGNAIICEQNQTRSPLSDALCKDLKARGMKGLGPTTVYSYLQAAGIISGHDPACFLARKLPTQTSTYLTN